MTRNAALRRPGLIMLVAASLQFVASCLCAHLDSLPRPELRAPLERFPTDLAGWTGVELPVSESDALYGEDHLNRCYTSTRDPRQQVVLWIGYSKMRHDRGHNPEVCMPAHGYLEDISQRAEIRLPGDRGSISRYQFAMADGTRRQWVYYWHYTFFPEALSMAGGYIPMTTRAYSSASSVTVELFVPAIETDPATAQEFAEQVDRHLLEFLPNGMPANSGVSPVMLIDDGGLYK